MAGSITVSSITLDSDNNFSIRSNTGATILSANGTGLITGIANGASIVSAQLTTPTITGNTNIDSGTLFVDATNDRVGVGTTNPIAKHHVVGGQSYVTGSASAGAYSRWYNNAQTTDDFQVGQGFASGTDNVAVLLNNANAAMVLGTNSTERMRIDSSGRVTMPFQPAFRAGLSSVWTAPSGTNVIPFASESFDIGSNYNTSTYRFTAPVAGRYLFACTLGSGSNSSTFNYFGILVYINATQVVNGWQSKALTSSSYVADSKTILLNLAASDYVEVRLEISAIQDISSGSFSGYLVG